MGASYGSILIKSEDLVQIRTVLETLARDSDSKFLVGPQLKGWVSVFPSHDGQDITLSAQIADHISADIFQFLVHDDDIFAYHFYRNGVLSDQYNSCPDYFESVSEQEKQNEEGKPEVYADLLKDRLSLVKIKALLKADKMERFVFESQRMEEFCKILGLPNAVGNYEWLLDGERHGIKDWNSFFQVPDLREAKRRAKLELKATKKRLQNEGLLLAELLPPGPKKKAIHTHVHCCADTLNGGFLIWWSAQFLQTGRAPLLSFNPLKSKLQVDTGLELKNRFASFTMSASGKWFVTSHPKSEVWDWAHKQVALEIEDGLYFDSWGFDRYEQNLIGVNSSNVIVLSLETGRTKYRFEIGAGGRGEAVLHPDGSYLVAKNLNNLSLINFETQKIEKTLMHKMTVAHYLRPNDYNEKMIEEIKKMAGDKTLKRSGSGWGELLADSRLIGRQLNVCIPDGMTKFGFSPKGDLLFCGTHKGVRVFKWSEILSADTETPKPVFSADCPTEDLNGGYVQDFFLDESRNQIVFCGSFGKVCYLNLQTGISGILLEPPEKIQITNMALSKERIALCCTCIPIFEERNRDIFKLQFWNYPALCKNAGFD